MIGIKMNKGTESKFKFTHPDKVIVDNITLTYNPKDESEKDYISKAVKSEGWLETWSGAKHLKQNIHYQTMVDLLFPDNTFTHDNRARLELNPRNPATPFLRLEYNPEHISFTDLSVCLKDIMPHGADCIFDHGNVTRLDIAVDIQQVFPCQIILDYIKMRFRTVYLESGQVGSVYIGKDTGKNQMYMYDKVKEMIDMKYQIKPLSGYQLPTDGLTRLEVRHRPKKTKFTDLFSLPNLFAPMFIVGTPLQVKGDLDFNIKRDLCVHKGLRHTINKFPDADRWEFSAKLEKYGKADFLNIKELWDTLPNALLKVHPTHL
jgi:hypothetical protein